MLLGIALTTGLVPAAGFGPAAPAHAAVTSNLAVISQQDGGCGTKDHILLANPLDGSLAPGTQPGKPVTNWGPLNEAKPIDFNRKIVGLWAGHADGRIAGVGVYDRASNTWPIQFTLPSTLQKGGPHSVARLPGDLFAVAHVGGITGTSTNGAVLLFDKFGNLKDNEPLASAHGVEWDESRKMVFAVGYDYVKSYELVGEDLRPASSWTLPGTVRNGHDLRRRRTDTKYYVTGDSQEWTFDPAVAGSAAFTPLLRSDGTDYGNGVKSLDQGFDDVTLQAFWKSEWFFFSNRSPEKADFCMEPYKFRWIYAAGTPVYNEEGAPPPPPPATQPAEPFLWAQQRVTASEMKPVDDMWLGHAADTSADAAYDIVKRSADAGNIPFIKFYHWGDDGTPTMEGFGSATTTDIQKWENYAYKIASALGSRPGYVVMEPEYDLNLSTSSGACSPKFEDAMKRIVAMFKNTAPNAVTINQSSFYAMSKDPYTCYADTAKVMHSQGFLIHVVNTSDYCTRKSNGSYFQWGTTQSGSESIVSDIKAKARLTREAFGTTKSFISDWAVTSCGWGGTHQAHLVDLVADAIPDLYTNHGLRGAILRTGGPSVEQRAMGVENEGGFTWSSGTTTRINEGYGEVQAFLQTMGGGTTPTFEATADAPSSVGPSQQVPISITVTNTGGSLSNGNIKLEVQGSGGAIVGQTSFSGVSWSTSEPQTRSWTWAGTATPGTYGVHVGVFDSTWATQYSWDANIAWITVGSSAPPAFTSSASASPALVAPGASTTISATVNNTGSTLTNGELLIEVYTPGGLLAQRSTFTGVTVNSGASATRQATWTAPADGGGEYDVAVVVRGAGGTPVYHSNGSAATVTVSPATFTSTGSVNKPVVLPGATTTFTANVKNNGATMTGAEIRLSAKDSAGTVVGLQTLTGQTLLGAGATSTFTWNWTTPATKGAYALRIGLYTTSGDVLHWNDSASAVTVADAKLTSGVDASPSTVAPGGSTTMKLTVTNVGAHIDNGIVAVEVYNSAGTKVSQLPTNGETGQTIAHGETKTYSYTWTAPTTTGTYTVKAGVWSAGWSTTYHWNNTADTVTVANPAFTSSALVSSSNAAVGSTVTITASLTNTGGALVNGNVAVRVYDSAGGQVGDRGFSAQNIANGATATYTYDWVPLAAGTYTVKIGVWNTTWGTTHHWNNGAATIQVGGTTFRPSFDVGDGANTWWIEVYTSSDVTAVDVIGKDGVFYLSLTKRSWGAWAGTAPSEMPAGSLVRFIARRSSDGATAGSNNFFWLQAEPTTDAGWICTITKGSGASTTWVEASVSPAASSVEVKVGNGAFTALTYSSTSGKWGKAMNVATGSKVVFRATNTAGARAYSTVMTW